MKETTETEQTDSDRRGAEPLCGGHRAPLGLHLPDRAHPTSAALGVVSLRLCKKGVRASEEGGQPGKERGSSL